MKRCEVPKFYVLIYIVCKPPKNTRNRIEMENKVKYKWVDLRLYVVEYTSIFYLTILYIKYITTIM